MSKKRVTLEEAVDLDQLFPEERRRGKRRTKAYPSQIRYPHNTYRLYPGQHEELKRIADEQEVSLNELVRWIFADFIARYSNNEISLPRKIETKEIQVVRLVYQE